MSDPMAEIKASFFLECEELLEQLQDGLGRFEDGEDDSETINEVFRAVHSIKGGAGAFGLTALVDFAHIFETSMDLVRSGEKVAGPEDNKIFMRASDILCDLVVVSRDETSPNEAAVAESVAALKAFLGDSGADEEEEEVDPSEFQVTGLSLALPPIGDAAPDAAGTPDIPPLPEGLPDASLDDVADTEAAEGDAALDFGQSGDTDEADNIAYNFIIRFRPDPSLFASGNEPLHLLKILGGMGQTNVRCTCDEMPALANFEPEESYLAWEIMIATDHSAGELREVFDFVEDLCELQIDPMDPAAINSPLPADATAAISPPPAPAPDLAAAPAATPPPMQEAPPEVEVEVEKAVTPPATPPPLASTGAEGTGAQATSAPPAPASPPTAAAKPTSQGKPGAAPPPKTGGTVRVDLERIDRLVNLVGELVINQAMLSQSVTEAGVVSDQNVATGLDEFMQLTRDIQDSVMAIRAQPVKSLFQRMGRIVRESSSAIGKDVRFVTIGDSTEVDKTVIERLADPLTHMIRNAVDHGLEGRDERTASGKPTQGVVTLSASHKSGRVLIEVRDDGAGINRPVVLRKAQEKGLVAEGAQLTESEIDNLLFLPGFSTASEISNLSGRGVGMDVVRNSITALGGRISISSEKGKGTRFSISLPLTLAVQDGMVIEVAGQTLVVPLNNIIETITLSSANLREMGPATTVVQLRDTFVPLLDLSVELGFSSPRDSYEECVALLISPEEDSMAAVVIDQIVEQRQVVIKGLQDSYGVIPGIAAATILGDGQIALILDAGDVISNASGTTRVSLENPQLTGACA